MLALTGIPLEINHQPAEQLPHTAGIHDIEASTELGARRWTLSLPPQVDATTPLVVVLHYGGHPTRYYGRPLIEDLFAPAWAGLDAIYVAPESVGGRWEDEANEAFVMGLIDAIQSHYELDPARTVLAGYSMGAIGSWHLVRHYPERFLGAVPVAGFPSGALDNPVPVYTLATASDEIFDHAALTAAVSTAQGEGRDIRFTTVTARGHYDVGGFRDALIEVLPWIENLLAATAAD